MSIRFDHLSKSSSHICSVYWINGFINDWLPNSHFTISIHRFKSYLLTCYTEYSQSRLTSCMNIFGWCYVQLCTSVCKNTAHKCFGTISIRMCPKLFKLFQHHEWPAKRLLCELLLHHRKVLLTIDFKNGSNNMQLEME